MDIVTLFIDWFWVNIKLVGIIFLICIALGAYTGNLGKK